MMIVVICMMVYGIVCSSSVDRLSHDDIMKGVSSRKRYVVYFTREDM